MNSYSMVVSANADQIWEKITAYVRDRCMGGTELSAGAQCEVPSGAAFRPDSIWTVTVFERPTRLCVEAGLKGAAKPSTTMEWSIKPAGAGQCEISAGSRNRPALSFWGGCCQPSTTSRIS